MLYIILLESSIFSQTYFICKKNNININLNEIGFYFCWLTVSNLLDIFCNNESSNANSRAYSERQNTIIIIIIIINNNLIYKYICIKAS